MPREQVDRNKKNVIDNTIGHGKTLVKKSSHNIKIKDAKKKGTGGETDMTNSENLDGNFDRNIDDTDNTLYGRQETEQSTGVDKFEGPPCRWGCGKRKRSEKPGRWGGKRSEKPGRWGGKRSEKPGRWGGKRSEKPGRWGGKRSEKPGRWGGKRSKKPGRWGGRKKKEVKGQHHQKRSGHHTKQMKRSETRSRIY